MILKNEKRSGNTAFIYTSAKKAGIAFPPKRFVTISQLKREMEKHSHVDVFVEGLQEMAEQ